MVVVDRGKAHCQMVGMARKKDKLELLGSEIENEKWKKMIIIIWKPETAYIFVCINYLFLSYCLFLSFYLTRSLLPLLIDRCMYVADGSDQYD